MCPTADDDDFVFVAPATAPSRPPNKAQLRTIRRQVLARRKQGEEVYTDEEVEKAGYIAAAAPAAAAPAAAAAAATHVKPAAAMARKPSPRRTKSPAAARRGGGRLAPKAELKKIKLAVAARRRAGEEDVHTDEEVTRAGWHLDVLKLADGPKEAHPAGGMALSVPKARQEEAWDCGLACAHMALRALGVGAQECSLAALRARLPCASVWSIELAYLLADYGVPAEYVTTCTSIDEKGLATEAFYRECLDADAARIRALFARATAEGVAVRRAPLSAARSSATPTRNPNARPRPRPRPGPGPNPNPDPNPDPDPNQVRRASLSAAQLCNLLQEEATLVVLLIDVYGVYADAPWISARGYAGHYVLLVGVDGDNYLVKDPARKEECLLLPIALIEKARKAHGTDEDLLLVPFEGPPPKVPATGSVSRVVQIAEEAAAAAAAADAGTKS